jgi:hypothetical protein
MAGSLLARPGRIFISYRREETAYAAGWLYDRLADHYGRSQVFKDVDSIQLGDDFVEMITAAVGSCDVLLALIGREWLTIIDERGRRRLDNPDDFVRLEIEAALARRVRVIPILVDGARIPRADELPDEDVPLAVGFGWGLRDGSYGQAVTARSGRPGLLPVARSSAPASWGSSW